MSQGRFGRVYRGTMVNEPTDVAIKVFPADGQDSWVQEQDAYKALLQCDTCPNVLNLLCADVSMSDNCEYLLFFPYHKNGSIYDYLRVCYV